MAKLHTEISKLRTAYERLRKLDPKFSKTELARRAKIHRTTVYTVFNETNETTPEIVGRLAVAMGLEFNHKVRVGKSRVA